MMVKRSKDFVNGFKLGAKWALTMVYTKNLEINYDIKTAIKELRKEA